MTMKLKLAGITAAVLLAFATAAPAQTSPSRAAERGPMNAEKDRIEAAYKADKAKCDAMDGNAKDVCEKQAKGKEKVAKAELAAKTDPSERNQRKVQEAKAEAQYDVAKQKCDAMEGDRQDACEKQAKAQFDAAKARYAKRRAPPAGRSSSSGSGSSTSGR